MNAILTALLNAFIPTLLTLVQNNLPAILAALLKQGSNAATIGTHLDAANAQATTMVASGADPQEAVVKAGGLAMASIVSHLTGNLPADAQAFFASLPDPLGLRQAPGSANPTGGVMFPPPKA